MAVTERQRNAILERDKKTSQLRHYSEERGFFTGGYCRDSEKCTDLHVHHIQGQRSMRGRRRTDVNAPENLVTTFACEHVGVCRQGRIDGGQKYVKGKHTVIHPDTETAFRHYDGTPRSFKTMVEIREELLARGGEYHDSDHDIELAESARERTVLAQSRGWNYPGVKGWKRQTRQWKGVYFEEE